MTHFKQKNIINYHNAKTYNLQVSNLNILWHLI